MKGKKILLLIIFFGLILRLFRLDYPKSYMFDEVYHAFTAKQYLIANKDAFNPYATPPKGVAYEWLHPPISKELMAVSMLALRSDSAWAWRLPGALLGTLSIYLIYKIAILLFKNEKVGLLSAFIFAFDGLNFVQSRIGMNDIYLVTFTLISVLFFTKEKFFLASVFLGIALSTKWSGVFLLPMYLILLLKRKNFRSIFYFLIFPPICYLLSYLHYFLLGYNLKDFIDLHKQIFWYQTNLKATHDYASAWWSWPLNLYPVWYHVEYQKDKIANIFASGNPAVFWLGSMATLLTFWQYFKKRAENLALVLLGFLIFWLPFSFSPRIMFLYHFSPSVPFLSLALGYQLNKLAGKDKVVFFTALAVIFLTFVLLYPFLVGLPLPKEWLLTFFRTNLTKNPF